MPGLGQQIMMGYGLAKNRRLEGEESQKRKQMEALQMILRLLPQDTEGDVLYDLLKPVLGEDAARQVGTSRAQALTTGQMTAQAKQDTANRDLMNKSYDRILGDVNATNTPYSEADVRNMPGFDLLLNAMQGSVLQKATGRNENLELDRQIKERRLANLNAPPKPEKEPDPFTTFNKYSGMANLLSQDQDQDTGAFRQNPPQRFELAHFLMGRGATPETAPTVARDFFGQQEYQQAQELAADLFKAHGTDGPAVLRELEGYVSSADLTREEMRMVYTEYRKLLNRPEGGPNVN